VSCIGAYKSHSSLISGSILNIVYRVNWLRANKGFTRCQEEVILVHNEMDWTVGFFLHQKQTWLTRTSQENITAGHHLFGQWMTLFWDRLSSRALAAFTELKITSPAPVSLLSSVIQ
jgi:hypothetical protein